ncbi:MAG TPA: RNA methyltransferase [Flavisolibacter sp.]|nr:RNA methyltransferase [Flavisolibacter sp.]
MLSKKEIKDIQSLGLKKHREEMKLFVAEGPKIVKELVQLVPSQLQRVYALDKWIEENKELVDPSRLTAISEAELERISQLQTPNNVLAVLKQFEHPEPDSSSFTLYLDTIQDPGNFGTIVRIADWFGIKNMVCTSGCADLYSPKVVQSTMASIARVHVFYDEAGDWLPKQHVPVYAATLNGKPVYELGKAATGILLVGNESKGLRDSFIQMATEKITIPRIGGAESLNAAVATGIILSHLTGGS